MAKPKFTTQQQLDILKEAMNIGVNATLAKYNVDPGTFHDWKCNLSEQGEVSLPKEKQTAQPKSIKQLAAENAKLKERLAQQDLFIRALKEARV